MLCASQSPFIDHPQGDLHFCPQVITQINWNHVSIDLVNYCVTETVTALKMHGSTSCKSSSGDIAGDRSGPAAEILVSSRVCKSHPGTCRSMSRKDGSKERRTVKKQRFLHGTQATHRSVWPANTCRSLSMGWKNPHRWITEHDLFFQRTLLADCFSTKPARKEFWLQIIGPQKLQHTQSENDCEIWCCLWRDGGKEAELRRRPSSCQKRPTAWEGERYELSSWLRKKRQAARWRLEKWAVNHTWASANM